MYEKYNYLSFYARIKTKTVLEFWIPLKIPYKRRVHYFQISFSFSIEVRFRWVAELHQFPI